MTHVAAVGRGIHRMPLTFAGGITAVACYLAGALLSYLRFPGPFGPQNNWLSDLGNANLNPSGARIYEVGVILTGIALLAFFGGLRRWTRNAEPRLRRRVVGAQVLGYIAAVTTVGTALISEDVNMDLHGIVSMTNIECLAAAAALSSLFLLREPGFWPIVAVVALMSELAALMFGFFLHTYAVEWFAVALILLYVLLMALNDRRAAQAARIEASNVDSSPMERSTADLHVFRR